MKQPTNFNILYLEDNEFDQLAFKRLVNDYPNIDSYITADVIEFNSFIKKHHVDLVIRDVYLEANINPVIPSHIPIVLVSGLQKAVQSFSASSHNVIARIEKPFSKEAFYEIVQNLDETKYLDASNPNMALINEMSEDDPDFGNQLIDIYLNEMPSQIEKMTELNSKEQLSELSKHIHSMQTKVRTFGLKRISELMDFIEYGIRNGDLSSVTMFENEMSTLKVLLEESLLKVKDKRDEVLNN